MHIIDEGPFFEHTGRLFKLGQMRVECEYCNRDGIILYAWHGDVWCGSCIERHAHILPMTGTLEEAPYGRPKNPTYEQPWIYSKPKEK